jgi:bifunctional UDP-N-acetylglucosamine pyrophosphorylase/glucosamine-1-phosphate N-acetyltransferase
MKFRVVAVADPGLLAPLTCGRAWADCPVAGTTLGGALRTRLLPNGEDGGGPTLACADALWPSAALAAQVREAGAGCVVSGPDGTPLMWISADGAPPARPTQAVPLDQASRILRYPWDLLLVNEDVVGALDHDDIRGTVRAGVTIDGHVVVGEGTVLLPGVYIEGNVIIGRDCKIGPNCYFRGSTSVGDNCHVGQAVEIKNSILMDRVGAGHLSYVGDSIVGARSNLGAGTITANFRHDGKSHRSLAGGTLVDTGRRKFGTILGDDVHTGIHTSIYPGRKIWPGLSTRPGEVVDRDRMEEAQGKART